MRRGYSNVKLIQDENTFYGVSLGFDFCAEHEWGIDGLVRMFGIDRSKMGIDGRTITINKTVFVSDGDFALLRTPSYSVKEGVSLKDALPRDFFINKDNDHLQTAWSKDDFGVLVKGAENITKLELLRDAFANNDVAITSIKNQKDNPFEGTSLSLLIVSKLPEDIKQSIYMVDKEAFDLKEYCDKIGMTELLSGRREYKAPKYFLVCSPRWIDYTDHVYRDEYKKKMNTEYDIMYWVNYSDDDDNYGWYTVEDIKRWQTTPDLRLKQIKEENKF